MNLHYWIIGLISCNCVIIFNWIIFKKRVYDFSWAARDYIMALAFHIDAYREIFKDKKYKLEKKDEDMLHEMRRDLNEKMTEYLIQSKKV